MEEGTRFLRPGTRSRVSRYGHSACADAELSEVTAGQWKRSFARHQEVLPYPVGHPRARRRVIGLRENLDVFWGCTVLVVAWVAIRTSEAGCWMRTCRVWMGPGQLRRWTDNQRMSSQVMTACLPGRSRVVECTSMHPFGLELYYDR